jgi:hypothetical protein
MNSNTHGSGFHFPSAPFSSYWDNISIVQEIQIETEITRELWELMDISEMEARWEIFLWVIV